MLAAVLHGHGGPDQLVVHADWPDPTPAAGEVLVRVSAAGVNNTDVWTREGAYGSPDDPAAVGGWLGPIDVPRIQGGDVAGVVVGVGAGVDGRRLGQRVLVDPARYADDSGASVPVAVLGSEFDGGFAELLAVSDEAARDVSDSPLSDEQLACLPISYGTALGMLTRGGVAAGETVLVTGASGGVGLAAVQLAAASGCRVLAVSSGDKTAVVAGAGADVVLDRDSGPVVDQVRQAAPAGVHLVVDLVAGPQIAALLPCLVDEGRWVVAGAMAGPVVSLDVRPLYLHNRRLIGSTMHTRDHFDRLVELARTGAVRPRVARRFPLADIATAQEEFLARRHVGKLVLVP